MWHSGVRPSVGSSLRYGRVLVYGSPVTSLDLALVGNGTIGALIDAQGGVAWCCFPRFDGDPVFCTLLGGENPSTACGSFVIELVDGTRAEQKYLADTPILVTQLYDRHGNAVEITDFCPRYESGEDIVCPAVLVRQLKPIAGRPSVRVQLSPAFDYGCGLRHPSPGANYISYAGEPPLRLGVNAPIEPIIDAVPFYVQETITLIFGTANQLTGDAAGAARLLEQTIGYWRKWVKTLEAPPQWRDDVVRAAITLALNVYEPTGAIIPAMTTSIPEAPNTGRNWDYRYCWPRDGYFTAAALGQLGESRSAERFAQFLLRVADSTSDARLVPIYDIDGGQIPVEHFAACLSGYRGMGPVRIGNKASEQAQHDLYGEALLIAGALLEHGAGRTVDRGLFARLERWGEQAAKLFDKPDAGLWELRATARVHTFSGVMCWVACDRLAEFAERLQIGDRATHWRERADQIHSAILRRSWNADLNAFTATMEGDSLDASLLLMPRLGFLPADDHRFGGTVAAIESQLKHGDFVYRYVERDDFGYPENAFLVCTFWYIEALALMGRTRREQARALFEKILAARNRHGLLAEDLDTRTQEQWGNFPQTYCMAGIIDCAIALAEKPKAN